jgi:hypothetical protein
VCSRSSMLEQRYHATPQNWFHPDMSTVNKNIAMEAKLISPPTYIGLHVKYPLLLSDFNYTLICSTDFQKNSQMSNFIFKKSVQ